MQLLSLIISIIIGFFAVVLAFCITGACVLAYYIYQELREYERGER
ncbi:hypothetical protein [Campylobacter suis]|nr:hypothetical protein [Campylobacter suis]